MVFSLVVVAGLVGAGTLHVYWAAGGTWPGSDRSDLARKVVGNTDDFPSPALTLGVASLLLVAALVVGGSTDLWTLSVPIGLVLGSAWFVAAVLLLRGVVGLVVSGLAEARGRGTPFTHRDVRMYSPFTLLLGAFTTMALIATA